jgi:hypothetical protein
MQLLGAIVDEASNARLPFVVIGGTAVNAFGHARLTLDLDLLVPRRDIQGWEALLAKFGFLRVNHEQPGFAQFVPPFKDVWPVDLMLVNDDTFNQMFGEASEKVFNGVTIKVPSPLHLIALKLHALKHGKPEREAKDLTDLIEIVRLSHIDIGNEAFRTLCEKYATTEWYERIRRAVGGQEP